MPQLDDKIDPSLATAAGSSEVQSGSKEPATVPLRVGLALRHGRLSWADRSDATRPFAARTADRQARDRSLVSSRAGSLTPMAWRTGNRSRDKLGGNYRCAPATFCAGGDCSPGRRSSGGPVRSTGSIARPNFLFPRGERGCAVTSHDVLQTLQFEPPRKRDRLGRIFEAADLILSVSHFQHRIGCWKPFRPARTGWPTFPTAPTTCSSRRRPTHERARVRADLGLPDADALSALGGKLPASQEPGPAHPCGVTAPGSGGRRSGDCADRHRCR